MSQDTLAIPRAAVAAAGRALQFTIAELSRSIKIMDAGNPTKPLLENEVMEMMDANKAMFSAIPFCPDVIWVQNENLKEADAYIETLLAALKASRDQLREWIQVHGDDLDSEDAIAKGDAAIAAAESRSRRYPKT